MLQLQRALPTQPKAGAARHVVVQCRSSSLRASAAAQTEAAQEQAQQSGVELTTTTRRTAVTTLGAAALAGVVGQLCAAEVAGAITSNPLEYKKELARKRRKIPESEYKDGPDGLRYYDLVVGTGAEPKQGDRVAIHFDVKFRNVTFMTSRQGVGVTGGTPFGFDVGQPANSPGSALPGIDKGVRGMRVGGQRRLLVPPNLAYGSKGVGEIPGNATLQIDIELLSIKQSVFGTRVKLVEG